MTEKNSQLLDSLSRQLLLNHEEEAPPYVYDNIRNTMEQSNKQRRRSYIYAAASVAVLFSFGMGFLSHELQTSNDTRIAHNIAQIEAAHLKRRTLEKNYEYLALNQHKSNTGKTNSVTGNSTNDTKHNNLVNTSKHNKTPQSANNISLPKHGDKSTEAGTTSGTNFTATEPADSANLQIAYAEPTVDSVAEMNRRDSLRLMYKYMSMAKVSAVESTINETGNTIAYNESATNNDEATASEKGWIVGGGFTPMLGQNTDNTPSPVNASNLKSATTFDEAKPATSTTSNEMSVSYATGISLKKVVANRINIRTGVTYNKLNINEKNIDYVEFPLMCEYKLVNRHLTVSLSNGLAAGLNENNTHPVGLSSISFQYPLSNSLNINLEPTYKHIFGKSWLYNNNFYGVTAGFNYMF